MIGLGRFEEIGHGAMCGQFVELCRRLKLFTRAIVAIDGSK